MTINMNSTCRVRLTLYGQKIREDFYKSLGLSCDPAAEIEDTLWSLMQMFGPKIGMGFRIPFVDNKIEIIRDVT